MTSFAVALEPAASPRLAAAATLVHLAAALSPWLTRVPAPLAAVLSFAAVAALAPTLARVPGRHCLVAAARLNGREWSLRLSGSRRWLPAELGPGSRAYPALVCLDLRAGDRRFGWLLPRGSVPEAEFRRLKARIRLSC
jgi:hypothetical protein